MKYDIALTGGEVVDPAAGFRGRMDVGIHGGLIAAVEPRIPPEAATQTIDVRGKIVTPGLVDIHAHVFVNCTDMGVDTDRFCRASGVTTVCDAGSAGSATFAGLRHMVESSVRTRTRAYVNLSAIGIMAWHRGGELMNSAYADPEGCARTIIENRDLAIGVKLRYGPGLVWEHTTQPLKLARSAADMAGAPLMVHITDTPLPLPEILQFLKPGDVITHCLHGDTHGIMGPDKAFVLKEVVEAQRNGIIFDCAHGKGGHFNFDLLQRALDQGFLPNTISTDLTFHTASHGPVFDLPTTMAKFMHFGVSLEDVVARSTTVPARLLGAEGRLGTLRPGAIADVAVFEIEEGKFDFHDTDGNTVVGKRRLVANVTIKDGRTWYSRQPGL